MAATSVYFDTSVLVKQYLWEEGSARALSLLRRHRLLSSALAPVELLSTVSRRRGTGDLGQHDYRAIVGRIGQDRTHWQLIEVAGLVLDRAEDLVQRMSLRTLDAVHMASALVAQTASRRRVPFVTADERQRAVAEQIGLDVVWVG